MIRNPALLTRIFNTPLMILPQKADAIIAGLLPRFGLGELEPSPIEGTSIPLPHMAISTPQYRTQAGYSIDGDGIAYVDVGGVLAHRGGIQADSSYIAGYNDLNQQYAAAMADPNVRGIVSTFYSPGGEVAGVFSLAETLTRYRAQKPMLALVDELAASAAFLLASAHSRISIAPTAHVGSVGIVLRHIDLSAKLERDGISITQIFSGSHKIDGHQFGPLTPDVQASLQAEVDALRLKFASTVALYLNIKTDAVIATEAAIFTGQAALDKGFAHEIAMPDQAIAAFKQSLNSPSHPRRADVSARHNTTRGNSMSIAQTASASADMQSQSADLSSIASAKDQGFKAGVEAERARITGILNHPEAAGRTAMAHMMIETGLDVETAAKLLGASPRETAATAPATQPSAFERHLQSLGNPAIGLDVKSGEDAPESSTDALIAQALSMLPAHRRPAH
jgi:ClpP class serine protease